MVLFTVEGTVFLECMRASLFSSCSSGPSQILYSEDGSQLHQRIPISLVESPHGELCGGGGRGTSISWRRWNDRMSILSTIPEDR